MYGVRYRSEFGWVKTIGLAAILAWGCRRESLVPQPCLVDPQRGATIVARLERLPAASSLLDASTVDAICFHDGLGVAHPDGRLALPRDASDAEAAARLAHLLHHRRHGRGLVAHEPRRGRDCDVLVDEALWEEAAAHALEMELRASLGVDRPLHPFESEREVLALPPAARARAIYEFLREHPEGGRGFPPLGRDYRTRCERD